MNVSNDLFKVCRNFDISDAPGGLSDHRMVWVTVTAPGTPFLGQGRYAIPTFITNDKALLDYSVRIGREVETTKLADETRDIQVLYKEFKDKVHDFARRRIKEAVGALEQKKIKLQKERFDMLNSPIENIDDLVAEQKARANEAAKLQKEINMIVNTQCSRKKNGNQNSIPHGNGNDK